MWGLSTSQLMSIALFFASAAIWYWRRSAPEAPLVSGRATVTARTKSAT